MSRSLVRDALRTCLAWLLVLQPGWCGTPVALPAGEPVDAWTDAFDLAGLEPGRSDAAVVIEADGDWWHLRAGGRSVSVPAPSTDAQRVEIAFLAGALARPFEPSDAPDRALPLPPAPPPLARPDPVPVLALPPPDALPPIELPPPPLPEAPAPPVPVPPEPPAAPEPAPPPEPARPSRVATPPLALAVGFGVREDTAPALTTRLRVDLLSRGPVSLGTSIGVVGSRWLWVFETGFIQRSYWDLDARLAAATHAGPLVRLEALAGVAWRSFRQQGRPIDEAFVPQVGVGGEFGLGRRVQIALRLDTTVDLRRVELVDETSKSWTLPPVEVGFALVLKTRALGDPIGADPTPGS